MKKIISIVLLLILAVPACRAWAQEDSERIAAHSVEANSAAGNAAGGPPVREQQMSYRVPEGIKKYAGRGGEPAGYVPMICQQLAEDLGVTLEYVFYDAAEQQIQAAENDEVDFSANVWSITDERLERYTMTDNILVTAIEGDEVFLRADPEHPRQPADRRRGGAGHGAHRRSSRNGSGHQYPLAVSRSGGRHLCRQRRRAGGAAGRRGGRRCVYHI